MAKSAYKSTKKAIKEARAQKNKEPARKAEPRSSYPRGVGAVTVEYGRNLVLPVYGEKFGQDSCQTTTEKLLRVGCDTFTITCANDYQRQAGWPEPPFANVNVPGALYTTKVSWLGFISGVPPEYSEDNPKKKERRLYATKLSKIAEVVPLNISGKIIDERTERDEISIILFASRKHIDALYKKYVG